MIETGARISDEVEVPLGTEVDADGRRLTLLTDGWHTPQRTDVQNLRAFSDITVQVVGTREEPESLHQFKQRFRTITLGQAYRAGVNIPPIHRAFERMNIPEPRLVEGMWMHPLDQEHAGIMPIGTLLHVGFPDLWETFAVFTWHGQGRTPTHMLGGRRNMGDGCLRVIAFPPGTDYGRWTPAEPEDAERIRMFKREAWELGLITKRDNSYCGEFEFAMARMGISQGRVADPPAAPGVLIVGAVCASVEEMDTAPVGTRISTDTSGTGTIYTREEDGQWNSNGYRHNSRAFDPPRSGWRYLSIPTPEPTPEVVDWMAVPEDQCVRVVDQQELSSKPVGTVIRNFVQSRPPLYTKEADGNWHTAGGRAEGYTEDRFHINDRQNWRYVHVPEVAVGTLLNWAEQNALPEGAILSYGRAPETVGTTRNTAWNFVIRDDSSTFAAHTRHLTGPNGGEYGSRMTLEYPGTGDMSIPVRSVHELEQMPNGTRIHDVDCDLRWTKVDGAWRSDQSGTSRPSDSLSTGPLRYTHIPNPRHTEEF